MKLTHLAIDFCVLMPFYSFSHSALTALLEVLICMSGLGCKYLSKDLSIEH